MAIEFGWMIQTLECPERSGQNETKDDISSFVSILKALSKESAEQIIRDAVRVLLANKTFSSKKLQEIVKDEARALRIASKKIK